MKRKPISRNHHYISQGYLAGFTNTGSKDGKLYSLDLDTGKAFRTSTANVAVKRDFNRVDVSGQAIDALENALSSFEGKAIGAIRDVVNKRALPSEYQWMLIFNFIALIATRNPKFRASFNKAKEQTFRLLAQALVSNKEVFDCHAQKAKEAEHVQGDANFEEIKAFVASSRYELEFHPQGNHQVEFSALDSVLPLIGRRLWSVMLAPADGPEFICSDHPAVLTWKGGRSGPIGFGLLNTELYFPLSRNVGLYGVFEEPRDSLIHCSPAEVAKFNSRVAENADRQVFSALPIFQVWYQEGIRDVECKV